MVMWTRPTTVQLQNEQSNFQFETELFIRSKIFRTCLATFFWTRMLLGQGIPLPWVGFIFHHPTKNSYHISFGWTRKYFIWIHRSTFRWAMDSTWLERRGVFWAQKYTLQWTREFLALMGTTFSLVKEKFVSQISLSTFFFFFIFFKW